MSHPNHRSRAKKRSFSSIVIMNINRFILRRIGFDSDGTHFLSFCTLCCVMFGCCECVGIYFYRICLTLSATDSNYLHGVGLPPAFVQRVALVVMGAVLVIVVGPPETSVPFLFAAKTITTGDVVALSDQILFAHAFIPLLRCKKQRSR
jgi:hypothetical protein